MKIEELQDQEKTMEVSESRGPQWSPILENSEYQKKKRGPRVKSTTRIPQKKNI